MQSVQDHPLRVTTVDNSDCIMIIILYFFSSLSVGDGTPKSPRAAVNVGCNDGVTRMDIPMLF